MPKWHSLLLFLIVLPLTWNAELYNYEMAEEWKTDNSTVLNVDVSIIAKLCNSLNLVLKYL